MALEFVRLVAIGLQRSNRSRLACGVAIVLLLAHFAGAPTKAAGDEMAAFAAKYESEVQPLLKQFCHHCHNAEKKEGGLNLARLKSGKRATEYSAWPTIVQRMVNHEMPPDGEPKLNDQQLRVATKWMQDLIASPGDCAQLATDVTQHFYRGHVMSRRLNRAEYNNSVRDLLATELRPADDFPADGAGGEGFNTVGDALFTNPILMEKYLDAADRLVESALPDGLLQSTSADQPVVVGCITVRPPSDKLTPRESSRQTLEAFARRAYRRPVNADDIDPLLALFDRAQQRGDGFLASLRLALKGTLVSPNFLFLIEPEPEDEGIYELGSIPLASRLSYFLWATMPDEELLELAEADKLKDVEVLRAQTRRMLADPRVRGFADSFVRQWLGIESLGTGVRPDGERFPEFNDDLAQSMKTEPIEMAAYIFRENRSLLEFIDADYTFVDNRLAKHYGLVNADKNDGADGQAESFRKVTLDDRNRGGLLGMASILTANSYPLRTSPVLRGRWLLAEVLGDRVPPPPPDVPTLPEDDSPADGLTLREQLEQHRTRADCASCHSRLDPLGFGLENFDPIGRWREQIAGQPVDASGELPNGQKFTGPGELKQVLLGRKHEFARNLSRKVLCYALGRDLNRFDDCVVNDALKALEQNGFQSHELFEHVVLGYPFRHRFAKK